MTMPRPRSRHLPHSAWARASGSAWVPTSVLVCVLSLAPPTAAIAAAPEVSGDVTVGAWSSTRLLDGRRGIAVARARASLEWQPAQGLAVAAEAWATSAAEQASADDSRETAGLREAYVQARSLPCQPALGKRFVAWGKTDAINPTDQISPANFKRLVGKDGEQRAGVWGLHLNCAAGPGRLQAHVLSRFKFHAVPFGKTAGVSISEETPRLRSTSALRYEVLGSAADWSLGWIDGHDLFPTLAVRNVSPQGVELVTTATRTRLFGGDLAVARGAQVYRAEFAWVEHPRNDSPLTARRRSYVQAVAQVENSFAERETLALQIFGKQLIGSLPSSADPQQDALQTQVQNAQGLLSNEVNRRQIGLTLRYARPLWASRGDIDLFALWAHPQREWLVRGRVGYEVDARWRLSAGVDVFRGPTSSYLGNLRPNSLAFVELSYAW